MEKQAEIQISYVELEEVDPRLLLTNVHDHIPISNVYFYPISNPSYYEDDRLIKILFVTGNMLSTGMFRISISGKQFL